MSSRLQSLWFAAVMFGASAFIIYQGGRIALRREIANPLVEARGGKALAIGLAVVAVGLLGVFLAALEGLKARG